MNESIYRSPKWLRNFADFEINTGNDIKGEPSEKMKIKIEYNKWKEQWDKINYDQFLRFLFFNYKLLYDVYKNRDIKYVTDKYKLNYEIIKEFNDLKNKWDKEWKRVNFKKFIDFLNKKKWLIEPTKQPMFTNSFQGIFYSHLKNYNQDYIYNEFIFDFNIIYEYFEYEKYIHDQERIKYDLNALYDSILKDFRKNPFRDKFYTKNSTFYYTFEDGSEVTISSPGTSTQGKIVHKSKNRTITYTVNNLLINKFIKLANYIIRNYRNRNNNNNYNNNNNNYTRKKNDKPKSGDPKRDRYDELKDKIKLREEHISKLSKNDPDRDALQNELDNYKRALERMKNLYKFEKFINNF